MGPDSLTILLVEDNPVDARLMQVLLTKAGGPACHVLHAGLLSTALARLVAADVDMVLLDLELPDSTGLNALHAIHAQMPLVPIVVLTGTDDHNVAMRAMQAGAQDYLLKGRLDGDKVMRSVRYAIERARLLRVERKEHAAARAAERRFRELLESIDAILWEMDFSTWNFSFVSRRAEDILGYPIEEWLQTPGFLLAHLLPVDRERMLALSQELQAGTAHTFEVPVFAADGRIVWLLGSVMDAHRSSGVSAGMMVDITSRKLLELLEREQSEILAMVAQSQSPDRVLAQVARMVENQCPGSQCCVLLLAEGRVTMSAGAGMSKQFLHGATELAIPMVGPNWPVQNADVLEGPAWQCCRDWAGNHGLAICAGSPILSLEGEPLGMVVVFHPRREPPPQIRDGVLSTASRLGGLLLAHAALENRLSYQAQHDALTGLPNRLLFNDRLEQALLHARRQQQCVAVMFIDLDGFKRINDTLGHGAGDELLCLAATRFQAVIRRSDTLARMGGDEFMVVLNGIRGSQDAARVAQLLLSSLDAPFELQGHEIHLTSSIGISFYPDDAEDVATLQGHADAAMYLAKASGRSCFKCYTDELDEQLADRIVLEEQLRHAIERGEFLLDYQPLYRADTSLLGFEALVRWNHPVHGVISPARFIPIAEESKMIHEIGRWVLQEACRQCTAWRAAGHAHIRVAVNVSALQFQDEDWLAAVAETLAETGLDPDGLELELTEGIVMQQASDSVRHLQAIKALGVTIAIDDFGTGYSSLAYLQRLPIDTLKIDQSFIRELEPKHGGHNSALVVEAIVTLGRGLGLHVLAEGVETEAQFNCLRRLGCHAMQGYFFGKPLSSAESMNLLARPRNISDPMLVDAGGH